MEVPGNNSVLEAQTVSAGNCSESECGNGSLQRDDRSAASIWNQGRDLVSGRIKFGSRVSISDSVADDDKGLALAFWRRGFSVLCCSARQFHGDQTRTRRIAMGRAARVAASDRTK